ncbi:MAG: AAA family ATPase [Candidatus Micrarchaeota archaeon]|nr:AAA family ATPase [Candidatus Micrarchaeota archaeon]
MARSAGTSEVGQIARVSSGIKGLDDMLYGGFPEGTQNLLMGDSGSGKTLLAFQIIYNNARIGIPCTFITLDQTRQDLLKNVAAAFPLLRDVNTLVQKGVINIYEKEIDAEIRDRSIITVLINEIINETKANDSKLLAIDSLSLFRALIENDRAFTRMINFIAEKLHDVGTTSVITIEAPPNDVPKVPGLFEESMFDGILRLRNVPRGDMIAHVGSIIKLRYSKFKSSQYNVEITPAGIVMGRDQPDTERRISL